MNIWFIMVSGSLGVAYKRNGCIVLYENYPNRKVMLKPVKNKNFHYTILPLKSKNIHIPPLP